MDALKQLAGMPRSRYALVYQQKNITSDLAAYLTKITYTNALSGQSDELDIELEDVDGRWRDSWYPGKGDTLALALGWAGAPLVPCGSFVIDEIEFAGSPTTVTIRALATGIDTAVRTVQNIAYEKTTLAGIARRVAQRQGLTLTGKIEPIALDRVTQADTDLAFLSKLAVDYDYAFKIAGRELVFSGIEALAQAAPADRLRLADLRAGWRIRDQIKDVPAAVQVKSHNASTGKLVTYEMRNGQAVATAPQSSAKKTASSADTIKQTGHSANAAQARAKAQADLARANREQTQGSFTITGRPRLAAGDVLALEDAGKLSGHYLIVSATHSLDNSGGYDMQIEVCRVRHAPAATTHG